MPKTRSSSVTAGAAAVGAPTMTRSKLGAVALATAGALTLGAPEAFAIVTNSLTNPNIFVCQTCTSAPSAPTPLTNLSAFTIGVSGNHTQQNPLLVIVGVYNGTSTTAAPTLSFGSVTSEPLATVGTYGLTSNKATLTATSTNPLGENPTTAYNTLGLEAGGSQTFSNINGTLTSSGITAASSFELFAFAIPASLTDTFNNLDLSGAPLGSWVIGYSCNQGTNTGPNDTCATNGDIGETPHTTSGFVDTTTTTTVTTTVGVPEPGTLALLGGALAGLGLLRRRRKSV